MKITEILENVSEGLKPIQLVVEDLSEEDAILLSTKAEFSFSFNELDDLETDTSFKLLTKLKFSSGERGQKNMALLAKCIQNPLIIIS